MSPVWVPVPECNAFAGASNGVHHGATRFPYCRRLPRKAKGILTRKAQLHFHGKHSTLRPDCLRIPSSIFCFYSVYLQATGLCVSAGRHILHSTLYQARGDAGRRAHTPPHGSPGTSSSPSSTPSTDLSVSRVTHTENLTSVRVKSSSHFAVQSLLLVVLCPWTPPQLL